MERRVDRTTLHSSPRSPPSPRNLLRVSPQRKAQNVAPFECENTVFEAREPDGFLNPGGTRRREGHHSGLVIGTEGGVEQRKPHGMTSEEHFKQAKLCAHFGLGFILASSVAHALEHCYKVDLDLGFSFLWVAVLMLNLGFLQHLKSLSQPSSSEASNTFKAGLAQE